MIYATEHVACELCIFFFVLFFKQHVLTTVLELTVLDCTYVAYKLYVMHIQLSALYFVATFALFMEFVYVDVVAAGE